MRETHTDETDEERLVPWFFPNSAGTGPIDIKSFGKQLADRQRSAERRLKNRTKATDALTLPGVPSAAHDLRRTAATLMSGMGISNDVINECFNLVKQGIAGVDIHDRRLAERAAAFDALGQRLVALAGSTA